MGATTGPRIANIQALRGVAAIAVVMYHAAPRAGGYEFPIGRAGVELFFVISGFVMATIWGRSDRFMVRRAARILPLYWIVASVTAVAMVLVPGLTKSHPDMLRSFLLIPAPSGSRVLEVAWTLTSEMLFYAVLASLPKRHALWGASAVIAGAVGIGLVMPHGNELIGIVTNPMNLCFVAGIVIAKMPVTGRPTLALCIALIWYAAVHASHVADAEAHRALWFGIPAALLVYGAISSTWRVTALERIGDSSYSLYLVHIPAMKALMVGCAVLGLAAPNSAALIAISIAGGMVTFALLERPIDRWVKRWLGHRGTTKPRSGDPVEASIPA